MEIRIGLTYSPKEIEIDLGDDTAGDEAQVADDVGPAVIDQVFVLMAAGEQDVEIVHPLALPARLQAAGPLRIGGAVVAHVDRARR